MEQEQEDARQLREKKEQDEIDKLKAFHRFPQPKSLRKLAMRAVMSNLQFYADLPYNPFLQLPKNLHEELLKFFDKKQGRFLHVKPEVRQKFGIQMMSEKVSTLDWHMGWDLFWHENGNSFFKHVAQNCPNLTTIDTYLVDLSRVPDFIATPEYFLSHFKSLQVLKISDYCFCTDSLLTVLIEHCPMLKELEIKLPLTITGETINLLSRLKYLQNFVGHREGKLEEGGGFDFEGLANLAGSIPSLRILGYTQHKQDFYQPLNNFIVRFGNLYPDKPLFIRELLAPFTSAWPKLLSVGNVRLDGPFSSKRINEIIGSMPLPPFSLTFQQVSFCDIYPVLRKFGNQLDYLSIDEWCFCRDTPMNMTEMLDISAVLTFCPNLQKLRIRYKSERFVQNAGLAALPNDCFKNWQEFKFQAFSYEGGEEQDMISNGDLLFKKFLLGARCITELNFKRFGEIRAAQQVLNQDPLFLFCNLKYVEIRIHTNEMISAVVELLTTLISRSPLLRVIKNWGRVHLQENDERIVWLLKVAKALSIKLEM
ncbi:uncharacterized protein LOC132204660 [Neocloeon triangulifer]|uniref:uncharacterized protein LOC132204660 n=1 Tax=Neocloeon triangulifer TaxID=2078957 RepID=UPI00286F3FED|nr:uncharacterized protein LOC132204660 [Neocloeon triangulifer]